MVDRYRGPVKLSEEALLSPQKATRLSSLGSVLSLLESTDPRQGMEEPKKDSKTSQDNRSAHSGSALDADADAAALAAPPESHIDGIESEATSGPSTAPVEFQETPLEDAVKNSPESLRHHSSEDSELKVGRESSNTDVERCERVARETASHSRIHMPELAPVESHPLDDRTVQPSLSEDEKRQEACESTCPPILQDDTNANSPSPTLVVREEPPARHRLLPTSPSPPSDVGSHPAAHYEEQTAASDLIGGARPPQNSPVDTELRGRPSAPSTQLPEIPERFSEGHPPADPLFSAVAAPSVLEGTAALPPTERKCSFVPPPLCLLPPLRPPIVPCTSRQFTFSTYDYLSEEEIHRRQQAGLTGTPYFFGDGQPSGEDDHPRVPSKEDDHCPLEGAALPPATATAAENDTKNSRCHPQQCSASSNRHTFGKRPLHSPASTTFYLSNPPRGCRARLPITEHLWPTTTNQQSVFGPMGHVCEQQRSTSRSMSTKGNCSTRRNITPTF